MFSLFIKCWSLSTISTSRSESKLKSTNLLGLQCHPTEHRQGSAQVAVLGAAMPDAARDACVSVERYLPSHSESAHESKRESTGEGLELGAEGARTAVCCGSIMVETPLYSHDCDDRAKFQT